MSYDPRYNQGLPPNSSQQTAGAPYYGQLPPQPPQGFGAPQQQQTGYGAPQSSYGGVPPPSYGQPPQSYGAPGYAQPPPSGQSKLNQNIINILEKLINLIK